MPMRRAPLAVQLALLMTGIAALTGCGGSSHPTPLAITPLALPAPVYGVPYSVTLTATGGKAPYTFAIESGTLPAGLTFNAGAISGTPSNIGPYTFTVGVKDSGSQTYLALYSVTTGVAQYTLAGQYFFHEQFYSANLSAGVSPAREAGSLPHGWMSAKMLAAAATHPIHKRSAADAAQVRRIQALIAANGHNLKPTPEQGSQNSAVEWGSVAGSIILDGQGNVTGGEFDASSSFGSYSSTITGGTYSVDAGNTGTLSLVLGSLGTVDYHIAAHNPVTPNVATSVAQSASLIEATTDGASFLEYGTGGLSLQSAAAIASYASGNYVVGLRGETCYDCAQSAQGDLLTVGQLAISEGAITASGTIDVTTGFDTDEGVSGAGIATANDSFGRSTATFAAAYADGALPATYAIYCIDANHYYVISTDTDISNGLPAYVYGPMESQSSSVSFGNSTFAGNYVVWGNNEDYGNESIQADTYGDVQASLWTADGAGNINGTGDFNNGGSVATAVVTQGTYAVSSQGRLGFDNSNAIQVVAKPRSFNGRRTSANASPRLGNGGTNYASYVLWMVDATHGYGLQQTYNGYEPGLMYFAQQTPSDYSNAALVGTFAVSTDATSSSNVIVAAGTAFADGTSATSGTAAIVVGPTLSTAVSSLASSYTVASNGRGTTTATYPQLLDTTIFYVVGPQQVVVIDANTVDPSPTSYRFLY